MPAYAFESHVIFGLSPMWLSTILLVVMGLSIILRDQTRHVFISAGLCLMMCGLFFAAVFGGKFMGTADFISPALAAWLPVLIFGPLSISFYDAIHT